MCNLDRKSSEVKSKGHLILTKQAKHLVWELEKIQDNNNVLCMLQYISSSSWSPKRSHQPWLKKEKKTLSKMNIAQSINFSIPSPTAGSQAIKSPHSGNTPTDILYSHPQFFFKFLTLEIRCHPTKLIFLQNTLEINLSLLKGWHVFPFHLILYGVSWSAAFYNCPLLSSYRKKCCQSLYVNT